MSTHISDIYHKDPVTINDTATIQEAFRKLVCGALNGLLVVDASGKVVGILSLQDIAAAMVPLEFQKKPQMAEAMYRPGFFEERCKEIKNIKISEIMRTDFVTANLQTHLMTIAADFLNNDLYIIPVIDNDKLIGIVTRSEIKKVMAEAMELSVC